MWAEKKGDKNWTGNCYVESKKNAKKFEKFAPGNKSEIMKAQSEPKRHVVVCPEQKAEEKWRVTRN